MQNNEAMVLWLDMLGYKNWLIRQTDLEQAERALSDALSVAFSELDNQSRNSLAIKDIECLLISDTIVVFTYDLAPGNIFGLTMMYHFLSIRLASLGLPLRGALAKGELLIKRKGPTILLGDAIVKAASLEPQINAMVVGVHESVLEYLNACPPKEVENILPYIPVKLISTKRGIEEMHVLAWSLTWVLDAIEEAYRLLIDRLREGDSSAGSELKHFLPKFINSRQMAETIFKPQEPRSNSDEPERYLNDNYESSIEIWEAAQLHALKMQSIQPQK